MAPAEQIGRHTAVSVCKGQKELETFIGHHEKLVHKDRQMAAW